MNIRHDMVTVFVLRRAGGNDFELLQLRRVAGDYMGGTWQTVRGLIEPGESAPAAALRELREETGLSPVEFFGLSSIDSFYTARYDTIWHCAVFAAIVDPAAVVRLNEEHDAFRWLTLAEAEAEEGGEGKQEGLMWQRERELLAEIERQILRPSAAKEHLRLKDQG